MIKDSRVYLTGDVLKFKPKAVYDDDPELLSRMESLANMPDSYCNTFIDENDVPVAVMGLTLLWPGVADVWAVTSDEVKKSPIAFHKRIKHALDFYAEELKIRKYQVFVKKDFCSGVKWMGNLGFRVEGLLEKYGPDGADYYIMGRAN